MSTRSQSPEGTADTKKLSNDALRRRGLSRTRSQSPESATKQTSSDVLRRRRISLKSSRIHRHSTASIISTPRQRRTSSYRDNQLKASVRPSSEYAQCVSHGNQEAKVSPAELSGIAMVVSPSRRISQAITKRPAFTIVENSTNRRRSEPFVTNMSTNSLTKRHRKLGTPQMRKLGTGRRLSTVEALSMRSNRKLEVLAQDELLTCLNISLDVSPGGTPRQESRDSLVGSDDNVSEEVRKKRENKRKCIIKELLETEQHYISCLDILNDVFKSPMETRNIIQQKDVDLIFPSSLDEILNSHSEFMHDLEKRVDDDRECVGGCVYKMTLVSNNLLDMYMRYVSSFPKSISTLTKYIRSSNKFRKFLASCYRNPIVERLDLPSFLLSPVQRLPRYILLLSELYKYTETGHPDKVIIQKAKKEMEEIISTLDSSIKVSMESYNTNEWFKRSGFKIPFSSRKKKCSKKNSVLYKSPDEKKDLDKEKKSAEKNDAKTNVHDTKSTGKENTSILDLLESPNTGKKRFNDNENSIASTSSRFSSMQNLTPPTTPRFKDNPIRRRSQTFDDGQGHEGHHPSQTKHGRHNSWRKSVGAKLTHWFQHDRSSAEELKEIESNIMPIMAPTTPS